MGVQIRRRSHGLHRLATACDLAVLLAHIGSTADVLRCPPLLHSSDLSASSRCGTVLSPSVHAAIVWHGDGAGWFHWITILRRRWSDSVESVALTICGGPWHETTADQRRMASGGIAMTPLPRLLGAPDLVIQCSLRHHGNGRAHGLTASLIAAQVDLPTHELAATLRLAIATRRRCFVRLRGLVSKWRPILCCDGIDRSARLEPVACGRSVSLRRLLPWRLARDDAAASHRLATDLAHG